jgi:hypothetical protein
VDFEVLTKEALAALDDDALAKYQADALAAAKALDPDMEADLPAETLDKIEAIVASRTEAGLEIAERERQAEELTARREAARKALADPDEVDEQVDEHVDETEVPAEDAEVVETEPALVASVTPKRPAVARAGARQVKPVVPETKPRARAVITAAADVPGLSLGATVSSVEALSPATATVLQTLDRSRGRATRIEKPIASITLARTDGLSQAEYRDDQALMYAAADETRLTGKSLVAAGGWCAPSETIYDLCGKETLDGLWNVPTIQVNRGGVNFTKGPQFADFYAGASIAQTETQAEAGTEKDCVEITCPDFTEVRLDVTGVCISVPILTNAAYPELVQRWISGTLIAHEHRKSVNLITRALALAGSAVAVANPWPTATGSLLAAIELVVNGERQRYRLGLGETLEAVLPFWIKGALRADLSQRTGVDFLSVTDQMVDAWFALRGINAQYVYGWQPLVGTSSGAGPVVDYPASLEILVYPAGTFVAGTKDVITLNGVYDSVGLSTNVYTALFTEEGISLMNMCHTPRRLSLALSITGLTAGAFLNQDFGTAVATPAYPIASFEL